MLPRWLWQKRITPQQNLLRIHEQALSPLDRLVKSGLLSRSRETNLLETRSAINPMLPQPQIDNPIIRLQYLQHSLGLH